MGKTEEIKVLNAKIPAETHYKLKMQAFIERLSVRDMVTKMIEEYCDRKKEEETITQGRQAYNPS